MSQGYEIRAGGYMPDIYNICRYEKPWCISGCITVSDCRQSPRLFAEDFSVLKRLKVSIFKTFQSLFGIIKVSKKAVLFYDDTRNRKSKKANADGMY